MDGAKKGTEPAKHHTSLKFGCRLHAGRCGSPGPTPKHPARARAARQADATLRLHQPRPRDPTYCTTSDGFVFLPYSASRALGWL
eukprot:3805388-Pyramimonas_sp.AAC.1